MRSVGGARRACRRAPSNARPRRRGRERRGTREPGAAATSIEHLPENALAIDDAELVRALLHTAIVSHGAVLTRAERDFGSIPGARILDVRLRQRNAVDVNHSANERETLARQSND